MAEGSSDLDVGPNRDLSPIGWLWRAGVGWPSVEAQTSWRPWAFKTFKAFVNYFETAVLFWKVGALRNVPRNIAVIAFNTVDPIPSLLLYMSPQYASQYRYYLMSSLAIQVPPDGGPIISLNTASRLIVSYVSILSTPSSQVFSHPMLSLMSLDKATGNLHYLAGPK